MIDLVDNSDIPIKQEAEWLSTNLRRSKRLREKQPAIYLDTVSDPSSEEVIEDEPPCKKLKFSTESEDTEMTEVESSVDPDSTSDDLVDLEESDELVDSEDESSICSDEEITPSKRKPRVKIDPIQRKINELEKDESDLIKFQLESADWFYILPKDEQKKYVQKMVNLQKANDLPSVKDIVDMSISNMHIKELISNLEEIDKINRFSPQYDIACIAFKQKMEYYSCADHTNQLTQVNDFIKNMSTRTELVNPTVIRIMNSTYDDKIKGIIYDRYTRSTRPEVDDASKLEKWVNIALSLPQKPKLIDIPESLSSIIVSMMNKLNECVYGMHEIKEEIMCIIVNLIKNPTSQHKAIGLCGPPGIGKTMLARIIADAIGLPMQQISLGGVTNSNFLEGHSYTYTGSDPGCIAKALIQMECTNGIIYLDEIDKISRSDKGKELEHSLLHITDFTQNHDFRDKYLPEIPINLSNCIFIYSMNSTKGIDPALISRMPIINFDGYTPTEKITLVQEYLLPEILKNYNLDSSEVVIHDNVITYIINNIHEQNAINGKSGVRGLKNFLNKLISRINLYRYTADSNEISNKLIFKIHNFKLPITITHDMVDQIITINGDVKEKPLSYYS